MGKIFMGGGGGSSADLDAITALASDVKLNKVIVDKDGNPLIGTMPDNGGVSPTALAAGGSYTIPAGYHNGKGKVTAKDLASQTAGTATASTMLKNATAVVNGVTVTGNIASKAAATYYATTSDQTISAGQYLSGAQKISKLTQTNLNAAYILKDTTININNGNTNVWSVKGTLAVTSAISFSAAARSSSVIRISWTNPSKGPYSGVKIRYSTSGYPGVSGGTLTYTGTGSNTSAGGTSYVDITGLAFGKTYYFTCYSYATGLGDSSASYNCTAATSDLILYTKTDGFLNGAYEIGTNRVGYESTNGFMIGKKIVFVTGYELNKPYPIIRARYKKSNGKEETRHCYYAKDGWGYGSKSDEDGWTGTYDVWTVGKEYVFAFSNAWSYFTEKLSEAYLLDANVGGSPYDYGLANFTKIALRS